MENKSGSFLFKFYLFSFLSSLAFYTAVLVPYFTQWGKINQTQIQLLQSWFMLWALILEVPTGVIADRLGRKKSIFISSIASIISFSIYGFYSGFTGFLIAEFFMALGAAFISGAFSALLYDYLKSIKQTNKATGIYGKLSFITSLGAIIATLSGSVIAARWGLNIPMIVSAIPFILAAIVILTIPETVHHAATHKVTFSSFMIKGVLYTLKSRTLMFLTLDYIVVYAAMYYLLWLYQSVLTNIGVAILYFGIFRALYSGASALFSLKTATIERVFGKGKPFLKWSGIIIALSLLLLVIKPHPITVGLALLLIGGLGTVRSTVIDVYQNHLIPSPQRATVISSLSMINRLALVILNPIVGFTADKSLSGSIIGISIFTLLFVIFSPIQRIPLKILGKANSL